MLTLVCLFIAMPLCWLLTKSSVCMRRVARPRRSASPWAVTIAAMPRASTAGAVAQRELFNESDIKRAAAYLGILFLSRLAAASF
jgi:hypothetical protein